MRLLNRLTWSAFPELGKFDKYVCKKIVGRARLIDRSGQEALLLLLTFGCAFIVWILFFSIIQSVHYELERMLKWKMFVVTEEIISFIGLTGLLWFPVLCSFIVRDMWLRHCIRRLFNLPECAACGYSLIRLEAFDHDEGRVVLCPECGTLTLLDVGYLSEADIDPALIART